MWQLLNTSVGTEDCGEGCASGIEKIRSPSLRREYLVTEDGERNGRKSQSGVPPSETWSILLVMSAHPDPGECR